MGFENCSLDWILCLKFGSVFLPPANEFWGKVIFSVACVKNSVYMGWGVCLSTCWDTIPPDQAPLWDQTPHPGADTPQDQTPPAQCMLGDMVNKRAACILLECNLVFHACGFDIINTNSLCDRISENFDQISYFYLTLFIEQIFQNLQLISYFKMILMCLRRVRQFPSIKISDNFWLSF